MRLRGWYVEGFGLLHDFRVEGLPDGLTVVLGPNEAGKTSLLAFIRGALFGYPDRRRKDRQYLPLRGGRHGGRLFVESDGSTWIVERFASPAQLSVTQPDGSLGTEADLRRLLGGVDAELHRNVFAFSLSELQEFESLQVEGVRDRIFAAGVVGAGRSARSAIDTLAAQRAEIGRKRGECRINNLRKRVEELDEILRQAKARAARHPELRRAADEADEEQKRIGRGLAEARREMARLDALLSAWPDWDEQAQAEAELSTLVATPDLLDDFGTRLESSLVAVRTQRERHEEHHRTVLDLEQQLGALVPDDRLAAVSGDVKRLAAQIGTVRARRERLGAIRIQSDTLHKRVEEEAPRLGAGWTSKSVREFDTSIPAAQEIADWGESLRAAEQVVRDAEQRAAQLGSSAQALADETSRRTEALKGVPPLPDAQHLSERDAAVRRLRPKLTELVTLRADLAAGTQRVADAARRVMEARAAAEAKDSELEQRATALQNAPELPNPEDLARRERAVRELRTGLAELGTARSDLRAANQRALDAKQRADEAELSASASEKEVERRSTALAEERPIPDAESLAARDRAARELRSRLVDLAVLRSDLRSAETRLTDRRGDAERRATPVTSSSHRRLLFVAAAVLCSLALALVLVSQLVAAGVAMGTAIVAAILAMTLPVALSTTEEEASVRIAEAQRAVHELVARIQTLESSAQPLATRLECSSLPDQVELEARADELAAQIRTRQDRDRDSAAVGQLRAEAQQAREVAQRLRTIANGAQAEVDNVFSLRVRDLEGSNLIIATSLGFAELPTVASLEEKAAECRDLAQKRRDRDLEASGVHALELEAGRARDLVARVAQELSDLRSDVEPTQATRVRLAEESALVIAVSLEFSAIPEPADLEVKAKEVDDSIRATQKRDHEAAAVEELRRRTVTAETSARKATDRTATCHGDRGALHADWSAWKAAHRCPEPLRPETAQQFFTSVERLRDSLAQLDGMDAEAAEIRTEIHGFSQAVQLIAEQAGIPHPPEASVAEDVLEGLRERVDADA